MKKALIILGLFVFGVATFTNAQSKTPAVTKRQVNQQKRIVHGVKSGELTKGEVIQLERQQKNIQQTKRAAKADGVVTKRERVIIHHKQNKASANVYRKKHNNISRK